MFTFLALSLPSTHVKQRKKPANNPSEKTIREKLLTGFIKFNSQVIIDL